MAIGNLFLGCGKLTFGTSNVAIAGYFPSYICVYTIALLCSMYPFFPEDTTDNLYHLQALRFTLILFSL